MKRLLIAIFLLVSAAWAQTTIYVDTQAPAAGANGSPSNPYTSINWSAINTAVASSAVTVYVSADSTFVGLNLGSSTAATAAHPLVLDGASLINTNHSAPSASTWKTNVVLSPCMWDAPGCAWASALKATITGAYPVSGVGTTACRDIFTTMQGFSVSASDGQITNVSYTGNVILQYNDLFRLPGGSNGGPGNYMGPANGGPCKTGNDDNYSFQFNHVHETYGECLYIGASTPDPVQSATPNQLTEDPTLGACLPNCQTGANYVIQGNVFENCAAWGGQGDGTDVKDGHVNLRIINNHYRPRKNLSLYPTAGSDGQGIVMESGALVDGNYIENPVHDGIAIGDGWDTAPGRGALTVRNNIIVNITNGVGHESGIDGFSPNTNGSGYTVTHLWGPVSIYNNTIYQTTSGNPCVIAESGFTAVGTMNVQNNICVNTGGGVSGGTMLATHDFNDYFNAGVTCPVSGEPNSVCTNPNFSSTNTPYTDVGFKPLTDLTGANLFSLFSDDYSGATRNNAAFDLGAWKFGSGVPQASSPTFSPAAGTYSTTQSVALTAASGSVICYNTSGAPATNGTTGCAAGSVLYIVPVTVSASETIFAVAGGTGFADSPVSSASYSITTSTCRLCLKGNFKAAGTWTVVNH